LLAKIDLVPLRICGGGHLCKGGTRKHPKRRKQTTRRREESLLAGERLHGGFPRENRPKKKVNLPGREATNH